MIAGGTLLTDTVDGVLGNGIGQVSPLTAIGGTTAQRIADEINQVQRYLVTKTRLGIPAVIHNGHRRHPGPRAHRVPHGERGRGDMVPGTRPTDG